MRIKKVVHWHGIDSHILYTLFHRSWTVLAGAITVLLIPSHLDSISQGYYFTFSSLLGLQIFFELGMGQVIVQIVAHEASKLTKTTRHVYQGDIEAMARLALLTARLKRWYIVASTLFLVSVSALGLIFFDQRELEWLEWGPVWLVLVSATAINLYFSWKIAIVEGFTLVRDIAQLRLCQSILGYALMWAGLLAGSALWSVVAVPATAAIATAFWLRYGSAAEVVKISTPHPPARPISWKMEILPFQWRIAVSWVSGYFIFQIFTPLIFRNFGAEEAGKLGMAITIFGAIGTIGMSWVNTKSARFAMMISRSQDSQLIELFKTATKQSLFFTFIAGTSFIAILWIASHIFPELPNRLSSFDVLTCLFATTMTNCFIFSSAIFMRAHREEPMLKASIVVGLLTALVAWFGAKYGVFEMMLGYALITVFVSLPWTFLILTRYIRRHTD